MLLHTFFHARLPPLLIFDHRIEDRQQLAHTRRQGYFFHFARRQQALVERTNHRIITGRNQRRHVQHSTHRGSTTPDRATTAPGPTIAIERRHANQRGYLVTVERTEFGSLRYERARQDGSHPRRTA